MKSAQEPAEGHGHQQGHALGAGQADGLGNQFPDNYVQCAEEGKCAGECDGMGEERGVRPKSGGPNGLKYFCKRGFSERTDPAALVIGPTGVGLHNGTLYVNDSLNNRIAAIPQAITRTTTAFSGKDVTSNGSLNDPLGMTIAPNGDILTVNGNDGNIVETTPGGTQIATKLLDNTGTPPGAGCLFGLAIVPGGAGVYFVDDCTNTLNILN